MSRKLSYIEQLFAIRNRLDMPATFQVWASYSEKLTPETLYKGLYKIISEYDQLSLQVYGDEIKFIDEYKFSDVFNITDQAPPFNRFVYGTQKPLWSISLYGQQLVFSCDHLLFDGRSGLNFHRKLRDALNDFENGPSYQGLDSVLFSNTKLNVPPSQVTLLNYNAPLLTTCSMAVRYFMPLGEGWLARFFSSDPFTRQLSLKQFIGNHTGTYHEEVIHYSVAVVDKLLKITRTHKIKLTALLYLACQHTLAPLIDDLDTSCNIPIDMRSSINRTVPTEFGLFVGDITIVSPSINKIDDDWMIAQRFQTQLIKKKPQSLYELGMIRFIDPEKCAKAIFKTARSTLEISNLGIVRNDDNDRYKIKNMSFHQKSSGNFLSCSVVSTDIGGINIALSCTCTDDQFRKLVLGFKKYIHLISS